MQQNAQRIHRSLRSTALCGVTTLLLLSTNAYAYNPNAGADSAVSAGSSGNFNPNSGVDAPAKPLPSTAPLINEQRRTSFMPAASSADANAPLAFAPVVALSPSAASAAPMVNAPAYATEPMSAASPAASLAAPIVYAPAMVATRTPVLYAPTVTATPAPAPHFPPVDAAVAAQAQRELSTQQGIIAAPPSFTAPAPLVAAPAIAVARPVIVAPVALVPLQPLAVAPAAIVPAQDTLSDASRTVLHKLPSKLGASKPAPSGKLKMDRISPDVKPVGKSDTKVETYDAVGLSIKVARNGIDTNYELNQAYTALMGGDATTAVSTYKKILANDPTNQDALFGLASTYHRNGEIEKARPYYADLLRVNPSHREGLGNFLALVSEESPNEALAELERLEQKNPDFSPIPAQEATVLAKLGYFEQARDKLLRAIDLAPENFTYKYNLAVLYDRHGDYQDAAALYRLLINASLGGEKLPASADSIQKRLNYISVANATAETAN